MDNLSKIIDESINLELKVSKLYALFHKIFPDHANFWWKLTIEEKNHAALVLTGKEHFASIGTIPDNLLSRELEKLKVTNYELDFLINKFSTHPPSEEEAFDLAIQIEESAGELHFQSFMNKKGSAPIDKIFRQLNHGDKDHAERLKSYKKKYVTMKDEDASARESSHCSASR